MKVGNLTAYSLEKNFYPIYYEISQIPFKMLHNQEQIIRIQTNLGFPPRTAFKYFNMDGTAAAYFTVISGSANLPFLLDMAWSNSRKEFATIATHSGTSTYGVYWCDSVGNYLSNIIQTFTPSEATDYYASKTNGYVQITTGESDVFIKVGGSLYRYPISTSLAGDDGSSATKLAAPYAFYPTDGVSCKNFTYQYAPYFEVPSGTVPSGHLIYTWYDTNIDTLYVRSIAPSGTMAYLADRWTMISVSGYSTYSYPVFVNQTDIYALHYIGSSTGISGYNWLRVFNIDDDIAAFINLNSTDIVMPAGTGDTAQITAAVVNCWGTSSSGKLVQFWVSSGDGYVSPSSDTTDGEGHASTIFYAGANVGISQINAVVNEV